MPELLAPKLYCPSDSIFKNYPSSQSPSSEARRCPPNASPCQQHSSGVTEGSTLPDHFGERGNQMSLPLNFMTVRGRTHENSQLLSNQLRHVLVSQMDPQAPAWGGVIGQAAQGQEDMCGLVKRPQHPAPPRPSQLQAQVGLPGRGIQGLAPSSRAGVLAAGRGPELPLPT